MKPLNGVQNTKEDGLRSILRRLFSKKDDTFGMSGSGTDGGGDSMFAKTKNGKPAENISRELPNGYQETIENGIKAVRSFRRPMGMGKGEQKVQIEKLKKALQSADAMVIGAGAGLSTSAGFTYSGERFDRYFFDFAGRFGISDMYSGGFYPFPDEETRWTWWARHIYYNRYIDAPKPVYEELLELVKEREYFVITTNVDHHAAGKHNYVFVDEVRLCEKFELAINSLHTSGKYDLYITGSNAFLLRKH